MSYKNTRYQLSNLLLTVKKRSFLCFSEFKGWCLENFGFLKNLLLANCDVTIIT